MLLQLTTNQIAEHWDELKEHLVHTLGPVEVLDETSLNQILESLLSGNAHAWVVVGDEEPPKVYAMAVTCFSYDVGTNSKSLTIYSLSGYRFISEELWRDALKTIKRFAAREDCRRVIAYTRVKRIIQVAQGVGGDVGTTMIFWEV